MLLDISSSSSTAREIGVAKQTGYAVFLHRIPFVLDALKIGFLPGFHEDYSLQQSQSQGLEIPIGALDNDFWNPDLTRYVSRFFEHKLRVGIIGDVYDPDDVDDYAAAAREIQASYPDVELIIVPKCREVIEMVPDDIVLGCSRGHADRLAHEFSEPANWRGWRVHILGGSPPKQPDIIQQLTQPTLTDDPPADIAGVGWNRLHCDTQFGEFWTAAGRGDSGRDADHVTARKTVRRSLGRLRELWQGHDVWPDSTPQDVGLSIGYEGPSSSDLDGVACIGCGTNVWRTPRGPFIAEYDTGDACGYYSYDCYFSHRHRNNPGEIAGEKSVYFPPVWLGEYFSSPWEGEGSIESLHPEVNQVSQRQHANDVLVDETPIDISNTQFGEIDLGDVPAEIESITRGLASEQPSANPLVVFKAARWWYIYGKGGSDPAFRWAIEWARYLAIDTSSDVEMSDEYLKYPAAVGSVGELHELR